MSARNKILRGKEDGPGAEEARTADGAEQASPAVEANAACAAGPVDASGRGPEQDAPERGPETQPENEVDRLRREVEEWKDKCLRARAEQQNIIRRATNEREEMARYANADLLRSLLDVNDDLARTVEAGDAAENAAALRDAVRLVRDNLAKVLRDNGVVEIAAQGRPFDPARHEALLRQPAAEAEPGTVLQVVRKGYTLRERVLRPARVVVAAAPQPHGGEEAGADGPPGSAR